MGSLAFGNQEQEAAVLHDELEPWHALMGAPTDSPVPVFECITGRSPDQQSHRLALQGDDLAQVVSHGPAGAQIVVFSQLLVEPRGLLRRGKANF